MQHLNGKMSDPECVNTHPVTYLYGYWVHMYVIFLQMGMIEFFFLLRSIQNPESLFYDFLLSFFFLFVCIFVIMPQSPGNNKTPLNIGIMDSPTVLSRWFFLLFEARFKGMIANRILFLLFAGHYNWTGKRCVPYATLPHWYSTVFSLRTILNSYYLRDMWSGSSKYTFLQYLHQALHSVA